MTRILVVDDEVSIRNLVEAYLSAESYTVTLAEDGPQGLALFRRNQPDQVVLDIMLPEMDGLEVIISANGQTNNPIGFLDFGG